MKQGYSCAIAVLEASTTTSWPGPRLPVRETVMGDRFNMQCGVCKPGCCAVLLGARDGDRLRRADFMGDEQPVAGARARSSRTHTGTRTFLPARARFMWTAAGTIRSWSRSRTTPDPRWSRRRAGKSRALTYSSRSWRSARPQLYGARIARRAASHTTRVHAARPRSVWA